MITKYKFNIFYDGEFYYIYDDPKKGSIKSIKYNNLEEIIQLIINHKVTEDFETNIIFNFTLMFEHGVVAITIKTNIMHYHYFDKYFRYINNALDISAGKLQVKNKYDKVLCIKYDCTNDETYIKNSVEDQFINIKSFSRLEKYMGQQDFNKFEAVIIQAKTVDDKITISACLEKDKGEKLNYMDEIRYVFRMLKATKKKP